jgi:ankyrin repeat protein
MSAALPSQPSLEWLRKTAKQQLRELRERQPDAQLADVQLSLAREFGFSSWRSLKAYVEQNERQRADGAPPPDDASVAAFLSAVGGGRMEDVRSSLQVVPQLVNAVGPHPYWGGRPQALHLSIETARREMFDLLLTAGADVNGTNDQYEHSSPLMLTVLWNQPGMQQELIARGARVSLVEALLFGDDQRVANMLRRGKAALPRYNPNGGSILAMARTTFAIDTLLELGAPKDLKDRWDTTPLEAMGRLGPAGRPLLRHLLSKGLAAKPEDYARMGDRETLARLIAIHPEIVRSDEVFVAAAAFGHVELVQWLLEKGANVNSRSPTGGGTALHAAAWEGNLRMAQLLVSAGANVRENDNEHGGTAAKFARVAIEVTNNPACKEVAEYLESLEETGPPTRLEPPSR